MEKGGGFQGGAQERKSGAPKSGAHFLLKPFLAFAGLAGFGLFVVSGRFLPNSRHWQQTGVRRGWRFHEDLQHQAWLRVLQGRRPPSVQWPRAQQPPRQIGSSKPLSPQKSSTPSAPRQNPTQVSSDAASRVSRLERCIAQLGPSDTAELKSLQVALIKSSVDSPTPCPTGRRLPRVLHQSHPTSRESSGHSGGRPGGSGQIRGGTSGRVAEVGGALSTCDCPDHSSSQCGSIHSTFRSRGRGDLLRVEELTREGQYARTCSATIASSSRTQSDGVGCGAEPRGPSEVMATLIEEADTDPRRQGRFTPY